jgi:hypothetical protein
MRLAEPAISRDEVIEIIDALTDIKATGVTRSCVSGLAKGIVARISVPKVAEAFEARRGVS